MIIATVLLQSFSAMTKMACICTVGIIGSLYPKSDPILAPTTLKQLSRINYFVFLPAMTLSTLAVGLSFDKLQRFGILIPVCLLLIAVSYGVTKSFRLLHEPDQRLFQAVVIACSSPNVIGMPLIVMQTMCENESVNSDYGHDSSLCFQEAKAMIFVFAIGWHLFFWSIGFPQLVTLSSAESVVQNVAMSLTSSRTRQTESPSKYWQQLVSRTRCLFQSVRKSHVNKVVNELFLSPTMIGVYLGIIIACVPLLQQGLFENPWSVLRPLGGTLTTLGEPLICVVWLIMSASLTQVYINAQKSHEVLRNASTKAANHRSIKAYITSFLFESDASHFCLTSSQLSHLQTLRSDMRTTFSYATHEWLLRAVYRTAQMENCTEYVRAGECWRRMGFQQEDPVTDLRGCGVLALKNLLYLLQAHPHYAIAVMATRSTGRHVGRNYPWAAATVNVTKMLAVIFEIEGVYGQAVTTHSHLPYWGLLDESNAFSRLFVCACVLLDTVFDDLGADYMSFPIVLETTKQRFLSILMSAKGVCDVEVATLFKSMMCPQEIGTRTTEEAPVLSPLHGSMGGGSESSTTLVSTHNELDVVVCMGVLNKDKYSYHSINVMPIPAVDRVEDGCRQAGCQSECSIEPMSSGVNSDEDAECKRHEIAVTKEAIMIADSGRARRGGDREGEEVGGGSSSDDVADAAVCVPPSPLATTVGSSLPQMRSVIVLILCR